MTFKEIVCAFFIGGFGYAAVEILFRGFTHWSMVLTGGIVFCIFYKIYITNHLSVIKSCIISMVLITFFELFVGCIVNLQLKMHVWDYSRVIYNVKGQICVPFSVGWFLMGVPMAFFSKLI